DVPLERAELPVIAVVEEPLDPVLVLVFPCLGKVTAPVDGLRNGGDDTTVTPPLPDAVIVKLLVSLKDRIDVLDRAHVPRRAILVEPHPDALGLGIGHQEPFSTEGVFEEVGRVLHQSKVRSVTVAIFILIARLASAFGRRTVRPGATVKVL